ncbi:hypothetical protein BH20ACT20_BH20ACT20_07700 [soil metagenome]
MSARNPVAGASLRDHLESPRGRGVLGRAPHTGAAGGAPCGDLVRVSVRVEGDRVVEAGFEAGGCAAARAAGSAVVELVEHAPLLEAASVTPAAIASELGGLSPVAAHAADLAADALHRAIGLAARDGAARLGPDSHRTLVAMSGGVDSAAAAQLALEAGEHVLAVTLELWSDPGTDGERSCCSPQAVVGARALAHGMGIAHLTLDLREEFRSAVVDDFLAGYADGGTPNPCVRCNGLVRFDSMLALARRLGAARLATGHYARIARDAEGPLVQAGVDPAKDQSYVLARLTGSELERLRFPLGELEKPRVRELARAAGLPVADKRESQDLCFLAGTGTRDFMRRHGRGTVGAVAGSGDIVDRDGRVLGHHGGHHGFTVGQRRGIGVSAPEPLYVLSKDARRNRVVVGPRAALATRRVGLAPARLYRPGNAVRAVRVRYGAPSISCALTGVGAGRHESLELELDRDVRGPAPGQTACLMRGDLVVGWGTIAGG